MLVRSEYARGRLSLTPKAMMRRAMLARTGRMRFADMK